MEIEITVLIGMNLAELIWIAYIAFIKKFN